MRVLEISKCINLIGIIFICLFQLSVSFKFPLIATKWLHSKSYGNVIQPSSLVQFRSLTSLSMSESLSPIDNDKLSIDISPQKDQGIMKTIIRRGDANLGYPQTNDTVFTRWAMLDSKKRIIFTSDDIRDAYLADNEEIEQLKQKGVNKTIQGIPIDKLIDERAIGYNYIDNTYKYRFVVDQQEVMIAWDIAIKTMFVGEISQFSIKSMYAFNRFGLPIPKRSTKGAIKYGLQKWLLPPNEDITCVLELVDVEPGVRRLYKKDKKPGESLGNDILDNLQSGKLPVFRKDILRSKNVPSSNSTSMRSLTSSVLPSSPTAAIPASNINGLGNNNNALTRPISPSSSVTSGKKAKEEDDDRRFFVEGKHQVDPRTTIHGESGDENYIWDESLHKMTIEIKLAADVTKDDLDVHLGCHDCTILDTLHNQIIFKGNWTGKIIPDDSSWAMLEPESPCWYYGKRLLLCLEKTYEHRDIWASALK